MRRFVFAVTAILLCITVQAQAEILVLNDPLNDATLGTRHGGELEPDGWYVTHPDDYIYYHLPYTVQRGRVEFDIRGVKPNECGFRMDDKIELFHMYDWTYGNSDTNYGDYRGNPYKHFIRKIGCSGGSTDAFELLFKIHDNYEEPDSSVLSWNPGTTYHIEETWQLDANGDTTMNIYRNGSHLRTITIPGSWDPEGHAVRLGNIHPDYGASVGAVYSNIKVYDTETSAPSTPEVIWPKSGMIVNDQTPHIRLTGNDHAFYHVRICTANNPASGVVWDSGEVTSNQYDMDAGALANGTTYYAFARLGNGVGWSNWSASGHSFAVNTSYAKPNPGAVGLSSYSFSDANGPHLGLGASYMSAMRKCKYYPTRFENDLAFLSSRGFNYVRILTMVGWYSSWNSKQIAPIDFTNQQGSTVEGWSDYWEQFRNTIDLIYDYGMRAEVTIFADAQLMPLEVDRYAHMDAVLSNLVGREHKVQHLEVANEFYQNGLTLTQLRNYGAYLAARTNMLVALSSSGGGYDLEDIYCGSAATLATEHFSRSVDDEDGWYPVRDPWPIPAIPCLPPCTSNEPIGPGSSVEVENRPIRLVSAACFAWIAKLPGYVYHTNAGVYGDYRFQDKAGVNDFKHVRNIIPGAVASWTRNDGKEVASPFTVYCNGQADKYWTDVAGATSGCHRNIGGRKGTQFVCYPQGILSGGLTLRADYDMTFTVYNPMTGAVVMGPVVGFAGQQFTLGQGPGAYIIKGSMGTNPNDPPAPPTNFNATNQLMGIDLSWANPTDSDFAGVKIVVKTSGPPASDIDGTLVYQGSGTSCTHTGLTAGVRYYYGAFAYDTLGDFSDPASRNIVRSGSDCYVDSFAYTNGNLGGKNGWIGAGSEIAIVGESIRITGGVGTTESYKTVSCTSDTGVFTVKLQAKAGAGTATMWSLWVDDPAGKNLARWYGAGTTARGRIGATSDVTASQNLTGTSVFDDLEARIDTNANTTQFFFKGASIGTLSHATQGAGDTIGRIRFERTDNNQAIGHTVYLDNLVVGSPDITAPNPVTSFKTIGSNGQISLNWTNPLNLDYTGTMVRYSTIGFPTSPTDGTLLYSGSVGSANHAGLADGVKLYYSAFTYDGVPNYSAAVNAVGISASDVSIPEAKALDDNAIRYLRGKTVVAAFPGYFYIQEPGSYQGIRVVSTASVLPGNTVTVSGALAGKSAERYIQATGNPFSKVTPGPGVPPAMGMGLMSVAGADLNTYTLGAPYAGGANNVGSLVTVWGRMTQAQNWPVQYFYIDDGCGILDGTLSGSTPNLGVRIEASQSIYNPGDYLSITGVVSLTTDGGNVIPRIIPVIGGIQILAGP